MGFRDPTGAQAPARMASILPCASLSARWGDFLPISALVSSCSAAVDIAVQNGVLGRDLSYRACSARIGKDGYFLTTCGSSFAGMYAGLQPARSALKTCI